MSKCINLCFSNNHADLGNPDGAFIHDLCLFRDHYPRIGNNDITKEELSHKINYLLQVHGKNTHIHQAKNTHIHQAKNKQTNKQNNLTHKYIQNKYECIMAAK